MREEGKRDERVIRKDSRGFGRVVHQLAIADMSRFSPPASPKILSYNLIFPP